MIRIGIIGAGISGLSAAYHLSKAGIDNIEILEARNNIGGRVTSFQEMFTKDIIDNGKHLISGAYITFFELLKFLGTSDKIESPKNLYIPLISKDKKFEFAIGNPKKISQLKSLLKIGNKKFIDKLNLLKFIVSINYSKGFLGNYINHPLRNIRSQTVEQLLITAKQNSEAIKYFWEPLTIATLNTSIQKAPADLFLTVLQKAFFADINSQKLYFSKEPLLNLINNEEKISTIGRLKKETIVEKIKQSEDGYNVITSKGLSIYNALIITLTPHHLKNIIDNSRIKELVGADNYEIISSHNYSSIMSMYLWTEQEFLEYDFAAMIGTQFHWIFRESRNRYTLTMSAANDFVEMPKQFIYNLAFGEIEMLFPKFDRSKVTHKLLLTDRNATVGFTPNINRVNHRFIKGLYVAGDWTNTGLPATIESAALSGKLAAQELIKDYF